MCGNGEEPARRAVGYDVPCFTEAMYLLGEVSDYRYQAALWSLLNEQRLFLLDLTSVETSRAGELMEKYKNLPMDLADALFIAIAESREFRHEFTIDRDFGIYRLAEGLALEGIPLAQ